MSKSQLTNEYFFRGGRYTTNQTGVQPNPSLDPASERLVKNESQSWTPRFYSSASTIQYLWFSQQNPNLPGREPVKQQFNVKPIFFLADETDVAITMMSDLLWLVVWNMFYFAIYWECHHPSWLSYFSGRWVNHQPDNDDVRSAGFEAVIEAQEILGSDLEDLESFEEQIVQRLCPGVAMAWEVSLEVVEKTSTENGSFGVGDVWLPGNRDRKGTWEILNSIESVEWSACWSSKVLFLWGWCRD